MCAQKFEETESGSTHLMTTATTEISMMKMAATATEGSKQDGNVLEVAVRKLIFAQKSEVMASGSIKIRTIETMAT